MRVVSLVPSLTETLLLSNIDVVGRTRFCIHPANFIGKIPVVGGTKDWNFDKIASLQPDLILLDREENPKFMSEQNSIPWHATHVESVADMPATLSKLSQIVSSQKLENLSNRWSVVLKKNSVVATDFSKLPGVIEWGLRPAAEVKTVLYMIWRNPWMCVSQNTFIGSVLKLIGVTLPLFQEKYPKIELENFDPKNTLILFSSEPYPFLKRKPELANFAYPHAFLDGESFSWFGVRSLRFLESCFNISGD